MTGWIAEVKGHGLVAVAQALGLEGRGRGWGPCPACGASRRSSDPRPPLGTSAEGGWQCHACEASGDAVDLIAYKVAGQRLSVCDGDAKDRVRLAAAQAGLCSERDGDPARPLPVRRPGPPQVVQLHRVDRGGGRPTVVEVEVEQEEQRPDRASGRPPPWSDTLCAEAEARLWDEPGADPVRRYLMGGIGEGPGGTDGRRLPEQTVRDFHLGALHHLGWWWVTMPILDARTGDAVNVKLRRVPNEAGEAPKPKYTSCAGRPLTLWGERSLTNDLASPVIVVEGELDVLALWAYGWQGSVVSGTSGAGAFDDAWLDVLEPYQQFVLAYDVEESKKAGEKSAGEKGAESLADRLGRWRCSRARMPRKDASECWLHGIPEAEIAAALDRAKPYAGMDVHRVEHWAAETERDISDPHRLYGLPTGSAKLDEMIGGWPDGVTVVTAGTKCGKSSLALWALREQALMGVPVLGTGFENGPKAVAQAWLRMQLGGDFTQRTASDRAAAFAQLDKLPIHLTEHYGQLKLDDLVQTIRFQRRRNRVKMVLVDHIGFLVDLSRRDMDETKQLQHAMRTLVTVANDEGMAVMIIAHPDKTAEKEGRRVRIFDIKGTSSIQQDCALGLSLARNPKVAEPGVEVHVDAMRSRFARGTGAEGWLWFDDEAILYADEWDHLPRASRINPAKA